MHIMERWQSRALQGELKPRNRRTVESCAVLRPVELTSRFSSCLGVSEGVSHLLYVALSCSVLMESASRSHHVHLEDDAGEAKRGASE